MARRKEDRQPLPRKPGWRDVPDEFWTVVEPLVPADPVSRKGGRPTLPHRTILNGILYVLRTGCQWKMMPREYGSGTAAHAHFQTWVKKGIFGRLWKICLKEYDELKGIDWVWQVVDSATVSAPVKGAIA
jgi:transposase